MEIIKESLDDLSSINAIYQLSSERIDEISNEYDVAKVCTPIIGKFSSGKSALVNTLLGYSKKILKEDITPETAVPAEIVFSEQEKVCIFNNDGTVSKSEVSEYKSLEIDAEKVKAARLSLCNNFLRTIHDVMIVDMPGFDSGFEVHNKAIDGYLPNSLAYIVAFPADDMIVRSSVGNILKEICLHDMPICIVITKGDKKKEDYEESLESLKDNLKKYIGNREVTYCFTNSALGDAEELKSFLQSIQERSQILLQDSFKLKVLKEVALTESYLKTLQSNSGLSVSELDEKEEKLKKQYESVTEKFEEEKKEFVESIPSCINEIKDDIRLALETEEPQFVAMAMNNQNINDHLNITVRSSVTRSLQDKLVPKIEKYLHKVSDCFYSDATEDINIQFNFDMGKTCNTVVSSIVSGIVAGTAGILFAPIVGLVYIIFKYIDNKKKREENKNNIRNKLHTEVFPQILREVGNTMDIAVSKQIDIINKTIDDEITNQRNTIANAMKDVRNQIVGEQEKSRELQTSIEDSLKRVEEIKSELR